MPRGRVRAPITCLALGLLTSVAIAWTAAITPAALDGAPERLYTRGLDSRGRSIVEFSFSHRVTPFGTRTMCKLTGTTTPLKLAVLDQPLPDWARHAADPWLSGTRITPPDDYCDARLVCSTGFPFRCAHYTYALPHSVPASMLQTTLGIAAGAIEIGRLPDIPIRLPCVPIWPGLLLNTLCWTTTWWLLLGLARRTRRAMRRRRNLCPACAYSRAGLDPTANCPECGTDLSLPRYEHSH